MITSDSDAHAMHEGSARRKRWLVVGGLLGFLGVAAGAFAAHALKSKLEPKALEWWETAARYQLYHAPLIVLCGTMNARGGERAANFAASSFTAGIFLFSGSLYAMALSAPTFPSWLGPITPIGGVLLLLGWGALCVAGFRSPSSPELRGGS